MICVTGKKEFHESASMSFSKDLFSEVPSKLHYISPESSCTQSDESVLKKETDKTVDLTIESYHTGNESNVLIAFDQPINTSETKTNIQEEEYSAPADTLAVSKTHILNSDTPQSKDETSILHSEPSSETFPCDSASQASTLS